MQWNPLIWNWVLGQLNCYFINFMFSNQEKKEKEGKKEKKSHSLDPKKGKIHLTIDKLFSFFLPSFSQWNQILSLFSKVVPARPAVQISSQWPLNSWELRRANKPACQGARTPPLNSLGWMGHHISKMLQSQTLIQTQPRTQAITATQCLGNK